MGICTCVRKRRLDIVHVTAESVRALMHYSVSKSHYGKRLQMQMYKGIHAQPNCAHVQVCSTMKVLGSTVMESYGVID